MNNWKEPGDGEYTRILNDGSVAKVFKQSLMWRAAIDDRMVAGVMSKKTSDGWTWSIMGGAGHE